MPKIKFSIVTPERVVLSEEIDSLSCPTTSGEITILPNHIPLISSLANGELTAKIAGEHEHYFVSGGFVEVRPGNEVIILADSAEHVAEIDEAAAKEAHKRAQEAMGNHKHRLSEQEYAQLTSSIEKNFMRLKLAGKHRGKASIRAGILKHSK